MGVDSYVASVEFNPTALFHDYIIKNTQLILTKLQESPGRLTDDDIGAALHALSYALALPDAWPDGRALLLAMASKMEQIGYRDEWMPYLERGIDQSRQVGDTEAEAELHLQLGILLQLRARYEPARSHFQAGLKGYREVNKPYDQARALNQLAFVALRQRHFDNTAHLIGKALELLPDDTSEQAFSFFILGMMALEKRTWLEAVNLFQKATQIWEENHNLRMMGRTQTLLGSALHRLERYPEAITAYDRAIELLEIVHDPVHQAMAQMNLGNVYVSMARPEEALRLHWQSERTFRQVQDYLHLAHVHHNLAMVYRRLQQWPQAEAACRFSIGLWQELGNIERLVNTLDELGLIYFEQNNFRQAQTTFEQALDQLVQIENEPGYDHKLEMITANLQKTREAIARQAR